MSYSGLLVEQGIVKRNAYGLSLVTHQPREVTFGAIITGRFDGKLKTVPIVDNEIHFQIEASSASINGEPLLSNEKVILDSGTSLTYLNKGIYTKFFESVKEAGVKLALVTFNSSDGGKAKFEFHFGGQKIQGNFTEVSVPLPELICCTIYDMDTLVLGVLEGTGAMGKTNWLGDTF
ncbi:Acid extracellular protease [Yarrowia sp. B02]|nr:Acid extracellular protease [Yarrowia sp. B02]